MPRLGLIKATLCMPVANQGQIIPTVHAAKIVSVQRFGFVLGLYVLRTQSRPTPSKRCSDGEGPGLAEQHVLLLALFCVRHTLDCAWQYGMAVPPLQCSELGCDKSRSQRENMRPRPEKQGTAPVASDQVIG